MSDEKPTAEAVIEATERLRWELADALNRAAKAESPIQFSMPPSIAKGLVVAQAAVQKVAHDGYNKHHEYKYTTAEAVIEAAREPMAKGDIALLQMVGEVEMPKRLSWWESVADKETGKPTDMEVADTYPAEVCITYMLVSGAGETWTLPPQYIPVIPEKGRPWDKALATATTYGLGYMLRGLLKMPRSDEQDDRDRTSDRNLARGATRADRPETPREDPMPRIENALLEVTDAASLMTWLLEYGPKAVKAVGMERLQPVLAGHARRLGANEAEMQGRLAEVIASTKKKS